MSAGARSHVTTAVLVTAAVLVDLLAWNGDSVTVSGATLPAWLPVVTTVVVHQGLWWRAGHPGRVFGTQVALALVCFAVPLWQPVAGLLVATYAAASRLGPHRAGWVLTALGGVSLAHGAGVARTATAPGSALLSVALLTALLTGAVYAAGRRQHAAAARRQRERAAYRMQRDRELQEQRLRIARELHDGVAGTVTTLLLQAAGARAAAGPTLPQPADASLAAIEDQAGRTLDELRRVVDGLRPGPATPGRPPQSRPDLTIEITDAVCAARTAGLPVRVRTEGLARALPEEAGHAVLRTVQEGLANALKHGDRDSTCDLSLTWSSAGLCVALQTRLSCGAPARAAQLGARAGGGFGLSSLAGRADAIGGELRHGPVPGGHELRLWVPTTGGAGRHREVPTAHLGSPVLEVSG